MRAHAMGTAFLLCLAGTALAVERTYVVDPAASAVTIQVGRAGIFKFVGHEHEVVAPPLGGEVVADADWLGRSSVSLTFDAASLRVTGRGEPAKDVPEVQATMVGPKVLDAARFPTVSFRSTGVLGRELSPGVYELRVIGDLTLHGVTRSLTIPVRVDLAGDTLTASGEAGLRQTDFDIRPVSAGAGTVKVRDELAIRVRIVARAPSH